jgi:hypothetical protein
MTTYFCRSPRFIAFCSLFFFAAIRDSNLFRVSIIVLRFFYTYTVPTFLSILHNRVAGNCTLPVRYLLVVPFLGPVSVAT